MSLASEILERMEAAVREGKTPQVVLDLDGTLFDNTPRTKLILMDVARLLYGSGASVSQTIADLEEEAFEYNPGDTLRKHGVTDEAVLDRLGQEWGDRFFTSSYLIHDAPIRGGVDAARAWWERGAELTYLTGRHVPEMFLGTARSLHEAGFPLGTTRAQLLMKPSAPEDDVQFKVDALSGLRKKGPLVLMVDNDPRVLNALADAAPEAQAVRIATLFPKDAPRLHAHIPEVEDFQSLLPPK